jgi:hypothetical protein
MKVFVVATIARQIEGEYVFIKIENGYKSAGKAEAEMKAKSKTYTEQIVTPGGPINCLCERGVFEVDVADE